MKMRYVVGFLLVALAAAAVAVFVLRGNVAYRDGTYEGEYRSGDGDECTRAVLEIRDGRIVDCRLIATDADGRVKDEAYGKDGGEENYRLCQIAVSGMRRYPGMLLETQDADKVDAVSGATVTLKEFRIAVRQALDKAR